MRRISGLLLLAILAVIAVVVSQYVRAKAIETKNQTVPPVALRSGIDAASTDWIYRKDNGSCPQLELRAREMESAGEPASKLLLKKVQLRLFHKCGETYDFIRSEKAEFDKADGRMFSDGDVEITLAVKNTIAGTVAGLLNEQVENPGRLLNIKATGVTVEVESGKARTEKKAEFHFDLGNGDAVGAAYDPTTRELELFSGVHLTWKGRDPKQKPMYVESGKLLYKEVESKVFLSPWAKLERDGLTLESGNAEVSLEKGAIRLVNALKAHGTDKLPNRELNFGADELAMNLTEKSQIEKIEGTGDAKLDTVSSTARTNVTTDRIELEFAVVPEEGSLLRTATATGNAVVESKPTAPTQSTRILKAGSIVTHMRNNGEEIEAMETHTAGTLDLIPNTPGQPRRHLDAERMWIAYGEKNQLKSFRAVKAATDTRKPRPAKAKTDPPPALTWSQDLTAEFHPVSGELTKLDQWNDFRYKEGEREAKADHATLDAPSNLITLTRSSADPARAWDPTGSVTADKIVMHQETGDFTAEGKVSSTRLPDKKPDAAAKPNAMLAQDEPMQATADRMTSTERNQRVVYEGNATLWQTANRLQARRAVIDRTAKTLVAEGGVVSQFLDKKPNPRTKHVVNTVVRAEKLEYRDAERLAHYTGGARMIRDDLDVKSRELRAWLVEDAKGDSTLDRAFADGAVEIFQASPDRTRRGSSEHAEYYTAGEKLILNGGIAQMIDSVDGTTRGKQLTYFAGNDTLLVEGAITQPVVSRIRRK
jgi:lipopolysaccharide export system protein LptA